MHEWVSVSEWSGCTEGQLLQMLWILISLPIKSSIKVIIQYFWFVGNQLGGRNSVEDVKLEEVRQIWILCIHFNIGWLACSMKSVLKGEFTFFIRELDVPPLGESSLMGPKKSVEVKFFFTVAFFGVHPSLSIAPNVTSTDFLGLIRLDSPNGGTSNWRIKKKTWTLPLNAWRDI